MYLSRLVGFKFKAVEMLIRPGIATVIMSFCVLVMYRVALQQWGSNTWTILLAICAGMVIYPLVLVALGGIRSGDVRRLPVIGTWAADLLERLGR